MLIKKSDTPSETTKSARGNRESLVATVSGSLSMPLLWNNHTPNGAVKRSSKSKVRYEKVKCVEMFIGKIKCYLGRDFFQLP
jgi:hypothetical protein